MPGWHRGLRLVAPLVARASSTWPYRAINAAGLRKALRQRGKERCGWSRGDSRGSPPHQPAVRATEDPRARKLPDASPCPLSIRQQTALFNSNRAPLAAFGFVPPGGRKGVTDLL